ncbi:MAG: YciI family protein [Planctomycetota bacterium]
MKYALIIHEQPSELAKRAGPDAPAYWAAWKAFSEEVERGGVMAGGAGLESPDSAVTVTLSPDEPRIEDGPYADSKELLGGFYIVDVSTREEAIEWARRIPSPGGKIEVRPLLSMDA